MIPDAHHTLILESLAEINARLRILDEAYARLEAAAERQLELLEAILLRPAPPDSRYVSVGNGSQTKRGSPSLAADATRIIDGDTAYARTTHPALFKVVDLLEREESARKLSVRQLAQQTGVSKSWCAIARRYVLSEESVH